MSLAVVTQGDAPGFELVSHAQTLKLVAGQVQHALPMCLASTCECAARTHTQMLTCKRLSGSMNGLLHLHRAYLMCLELQLLVCMIIQTERINLSASNEVTSSVMCAPCM